MKVVEIVGNIYGRLIVLSRSENCSDGKAAYLCKCSCGNTKVIPSINLRRGFTTSCGCYRKEFRRNGFHPVINDLFSTYKQGAIKKKREFTLTKEELQTIVTSDCVYCGAPPSRKHRPERITSNFRVNGIDRRDNSVGYITNNVQPCCSICNQAKHTLSETAFLGWIGRVFNHKGNK